MQCFDSLLGRFLTAVLKLLLFITATRFWQVKLNKGSGAGQAVGDAISALASQSFPRASVQGEI